MTRNEKLIKALAECQPTDPPDKLWDAILEENGSIFISKRIHNGETIWCLSINDGFEPDTRTYFGRTIAEVMAVFGQGEALRIIGTSRLCLN